MKKKKQQLVRILALVLAALMVGGTVLSVMVSAFAEEADSERDLCELEMIYMDEEQALQITQRLVYHNRTDAPMDRVIFYAAGNMYRRESSLMYESDALAAAFPLGFAPAGLDIQSITCDGKSADWGFQGRQEMVLRVACDLQPGESCVFEFDYFLLLTQNCSMIGQYETDLRLSAFYFAPAMPYEGDFITYEPLQFTRWLCTDAADFRVKIALPDAVLPAAVGTEALISSENHTNVWEFRAENVREFSLAFGRRYRESKRTAQGVEVRVLSNNRSGAALALDYACELIDLYTRWLGDFPIAQIDLVQSDYTAGALNFPGAVWIPNEFWSDEARLKQALRFCLAQQYIGLSAYPEPVTDAWLSDVPCTYLSLLAVEELDGYNAFLGALNDRVLHALNITVPGGLYISADANLFTAEEYDLIVLGRGTVVMHEMRVAMGREAWISGLRRFYEMGQEKNVLGEYDFVAAFDEVTGSSWEQFITDWLFSVGDYLDQQVDFYE